MKLGINEIGWLAKSTSWFFTTKCLYLFNNLKKLVVCSIKKILNMNKKKTLQNCPSFKVLRVFSVLLMEFYKMKFY